MLLAWLVFPIVLALVGAGWGLLCRDLLGIELDGALVVPFGIAALIVAAGLLTAWSAIAPATVIVIAAVAVAGLVRGRSQLRPDGGAVLVGVLALLAFGAPVILSGQATFAGYLRLDDTATWFSVVDRVISHGRSLASLPPSTYALNLHSYLSGMGYPIGSFLPLGVGRALVGVDVAWVFQPYLAFCGAMVGLVAYSMSRRLIERRWLRVLVAFLAAQPALLYGYSQWGGIKELTAAFLVILVAAIVGNALGRPGERRSMLGAVAIGFAALGVTLGPGAIAWLAPAGLAVLAAWIWHARGAASGAGGGAARTSSVSAALAPMRAAVRDLALLGAALAVLFVPVWVTLGSFFAGDTGLFSSGAATSTMGKSGLVSLLHPLSAFQLAGVWPVGDFRLTASAGATVPLLVAVAIGVGVGVGRGAFRREQALAAYAAVALFGALIVWLGGSTPWVVAKALAIGSPAVPTIALLGAAALFERRPAVASVLIAVIGGGVLWSNVLAYHDVTLAPRARLAELQTIAPMLNGHGPTLINEYEVYADRHFLRDAAPVEPAEYRPYLVPLADGQLLTQSAQADLDSFSASTLIAYPSIVTRTSPVASRPPSIYRLRWQGRYYQLWQRPLHPVATIIRHVPLGDDSAHPFCGQSTSEYEPVCSIQPAAVAPCSLIRRLASVARADGAELVAYQRAAPIVARADQTRWPGAWQYDPTARTLMPTDPGDLTAHIAVSSDQRYELWLGGSFARGFQVTVDGRPLGAVKDQLASIGQYVPIGLLSLSPGVHTIVLRYPPADLTPGSGTEMTTLSAIVLQPLGSPATTMLTVAPRQASELCGRELDWIEVVKP